MILSIFNLLATSNSDVNEWLKSTLGLFSIAMFVIYGVTAGLGTMLFAFHALMYKKAGSSEEPEAEMKKHKKHMKNVLIGILLIYSAEAIIHLISAIVISLYHPHIV